MVFCERCGRLLNRATGRCVCDDDPALAAPVPASPPLAAANPAPSARPQLAPPGAQDGAQPGNSSLLTKEVAEAAVAARRVTALNGRPAESPEPAPVAPVPAAITLGSQRSVIADFREGRERVDLRFHEHGLVLEPVPGLDPVLIARIVGTVLLGPLGYLLGTALGRRRASKERQLRLASRFALEPGEGGGEVIPLEQIVAVTVQRLPWGGTVHIGGGGVSRTLRFARHDREVNDVAGQFQAAVGRRFSLLPTPNNLDRAHRVGRVVLVAAAVLMVALPVKAVVFPAAEVGDDVPAAARKPLRQVCPAWRAAPLGGAQLAATAQQIRPALEQAAAADAAFASLPADITMVESFSAKAWTPDASLTEAAEFSAAVDRIDAACARVGR